MAKPEQVLIIEPQGELRFRGTLRHLDRERRTDRERERETQDRERERERDELVSRRAF